MKGVSVIICCFNSALRLPKTLEYLSRQKNVAEIPWEIIVVDNLSRDQTREVAYTEWRKYGQPTTLSVVDQPIQGISYAREKGVHVSKYDVLIFCDDDNWIDENYLSLAYTFINADDRIGAVGGQGLVASDVDIPLWFSKFNGFYACAPQGLDIEEVSSTRGYLYGAGLVIRKRAWQSVQVDQGINILSGRKGKLLLSGEDVELCFKLRIMGWQLWYNKNLTFFHFMPKERLSLTYLRKITKGISASGVYLNSYKYFIEKKEVTKLVWLKDIVFNTVRMITSLAKLVRQNTVEHKVIFWMHSGCVKSLLKQFTSYRANYKKIKFCFEMAIAKR